MRNKVAKRIRAESPGKVMSPTQREPQRLVSKYRQVKKSYNQARRAQRR